MDAQSIIRQLIRQVDKEGAKNPGGYVASIRVRLGELNGVDPKAVCSEFEKRVQGTAHRASLLTVELVVAEAVCQQCGHKFWLRKGKSECEKCGSMRLSLHGGDEFCID